MDKCVKFVVSRMEAIATRTPGMGVRALVVLLLLILTSSVGWAQGLQTTKPCTVTDQTVQAYLCLDDIVVVDGGSSGIYLVDPATGNQKPISTAVNAATIINGTTVNLLNQAASIAIERGTGKLLVSTRTYGIIRVDPKDGSQEWLLKGGTGWGAYPTLNSGDPFVYPGGITVDLDGSILATDTGIRLNSTNCQKDAKGNIIVTTCDHDPGKIIRINKGTGD